MRGAIRRRLGQLKRRRHLRSSDVFFASYPKSGNTWVRFIWANLVSLTDLDGRTVDFRVLNQELVAEYDSNTWGPIVPRRLFRLVKTHREYDSSTFSGHPVLYVWRHPGDVAVSYFHFLRARRDGPELVSFSGFLRHPEWGLDAWCRHVAGWLPKSDSVARYEEFRADAVGTMRRVLSELGATWIDETLLKEAVARSAFERVRELEERHGRPASGEFREGYRFARQGDSGAWHDQFSEADQRYLEEVLARHRLSRHFEEAYG